MKCTRRDLVLAADGRHSILRERAGLESFTWALRWMCCEGVVITIDRGDHWQRAYVIPKGAFDEIRRNGIERFAIIWRRWLPSCATAWPSRAA